MRINLSIFKNENKTKILKFSLILLIKNKMILALLAFISFILLFIHFYLTKNQEWLFKKYSFIENVVPFSMLIIFNGFAVMMLFSISKKNQVDLMLWTKQIKDWKIIVQKQIAVFTLSLFIPTIVSLEFIASLFRSEHSLNLSLWWIAEVLSLMICSLITIFIFAFISSSTKYLKGMLIDASLALILAISLFIPLVTVKAKENKLNFDVSVNKNSFVRVNEIDAKGNLVSSFDSIYQNPLALNNNDLSFEKENNLLKFDPFIGFTLFSTPAISSIISNNNKIDDDASYSINRYEWNKVDFSASDKSNTLMMTNPNIKSIFDFEDESKLYDAVIQEITSMPLIEDNLLNKSYWQVVINELTSRAIWDSSLQNKYKELIKHLYGINKSDSILYDVQRNILNLRNNLFSKFYEYLGNKTSSDFASFIKYIWESKNVDLNVYAYQTLVSKNDIEKYHPSFRVFNSRENADEYDVEYIKNKLLKAEETNGKFTLKVLESIKGSTEDKYDELKTTEIRNIFGKEISSIKDFDDFINSNSTVNNLEDLLNKVRAVVPDVMPMSFKNNVNNYSLINSQVKILASSKFSFSIFFAFLFILIGALSQYLTISFVPRKDIS